MVSLHIQLWHNIVNGEKLLIKTPIIDREYSKWAKLKVQEFKVMQMYVRIMEEMLMSYLSRRQAYSF